MMSRVPDGSSAPLPMTEADDKLRNLQTGALEESRTMSDLMPREMPRQGCL